MRGWLCTHPSPPISQSLPSAEGLVQGLGPEAQPNPLSEPILSRPGGPPLGTETIPAMASEGSRLAMLPPSHLAPWAGARQLRL